MNDSGNYGLILWSLRKKAGFSVRGMSKKIGRSIGWLSEIENNTGTARLTEHEFDRIVSLMDGDKHRPMFRTWVAQHRNSERFDNTFDGAVLKFLRMKKGLNLINASNAASLSPSYLSKVEKGLKTVTVEVRNRLMVVYDYSPSSFKNLSSDPVRSKAVPVRYKLDILLKTLPAAEMGKLFEYVTILSQNTNS